MSNDCTNAIESAATFADLRATVLRTVRELSRADGVTFVLRDGDNCFYVDEDGIAPMWKGQRFPLAQCISGWAMRRGDVAQVGDVFADDRIPVDAYRPTFVRSLVVVPMGVDDAPGAIGVYWARTGLHLPRGVLPQLYEIGAACGAKVTELGLDVAPWAPNFSLAASA